MSLQIERRFVRGGQLRAKQGDKLGIEGYSAVFDQPYDNGWFIETIKPGAFSRALREKQDVRCLFNHDPNNLIGRSKSGTLTMEEDTTGLHFACDTNPDVRVAVDVQGMISRGDLDGCSFAFQATKVTWREEKNADGQYIQYRDIEDLDLFDVGPVTYPAYEGTSVSERTLWPNGVPAEVRSHVPKLRSSKNSDGDPEPGLKNKTDDPKPADQAQQLKDLQAVAHKIKVDCEEIVQAVAGAVADPSAAIDSCRDELEDIAKAAQAALEQLPAESDDERTARRQRRATSNQCDCECDSCQDGNCGDCDCDGTCDADNCGSEDCRCGDAARMKMRLRMAESSL
jgi:HK97 family phage prohead protease